MNSLKKFYAYLHLRAAVNMADKARAKYHKRFFLLPGTNGELLVSDRKNFRGLRAKHWVKGAKYLMPKEVSETSFYYTSHGDGTGFMPESQKRAKREEYYAWYEKSKKDYKAQKKAKKAAAKEKKERERKNRRDARKK